MSIKRRMPACSGYIGAGNKTSVFNRKPKVAFKKIRSHLDQEFKKVHSSAPGKQPLSEQEREEIKLRVRKRIRTSRRKEIFYAIIASLIGLVLIFLALLYLN